MMLDNLTANLKSPGKYDEAKDKRSGKAKPLKLKGNPVEAPELADDGSHKTKGKPSKGKKAEAIDTLRDILTEGDSE